MSMHIGFVGLGMMGYPMAHRLAEAGHTLTVMDLAPSAIARFLNEHPGTACAVAPTDFASAELVITMLPDSAAVDAVVLGKEDTPGIAVSMAPGTVLIDMSSSEPMHSCMLAKALRERQIDYLDAPVSGGVKRAVDGSLAIMVGGDRQVLDRCKQVLSALGKGITWVGSAGAGHAMKALNNYVSAAGLVATVEALYVGQAFGLDPEVMINVMNNSTGKNNTTENKARQFMLSQTFNSGFSLSLMAKDLGIAMGLGRSLSQPMQLGEEVLQIWRNADQSLGAGADHTEMFRYLQRESK
jgi:3-hydroxyisobutyrate dehydrogenase